MIRIVLPPKHRGPDCPYVQRTKNLVRMLAMLGEAYEAYWDAESMQADPGDLVFYTMPMGPQVVPLGTIPVECGVGYDLKPWGAYRVYESEAWRHYCFGKWDVSLKHRRNSWVVPWAFDPDEWPLGDGSGAYVSYMGRLFPDKGIATIIEIAKALPNVLFRVASTEHWAYTALPNLEMVGPLYGTARADFLGKAVAHLCPTEYVEPLGGSAIEAMLCGTLVVCSTYGGFSESVMDKVSGFRCRDSAEMIPYIEALLNSWMVDRLVVRQHAMAYAIQNVLPHWEHCLSQLRTLGTSAEVSR
jgi:glycosyltransferase involved in cell wall biosynthesis